MYNSYYSGRNAYYMEMIVKAGLVGAPRQCAAACGPTWRDAPGPGHEPHMLRLPCDAWTGDFRHWHLGTHVGEVLLHAHLDKPLPAGTGVDKDGNPTTEASEVLLGGVLPFGAIKARASP